MESDIKDISGTLIEDKDKLAFNYEGQAIIATVKYKNGLFGVNCPDNKPFSCLLKDLHTYVSDFEITI